MFDLMNPGDMFPQLPMPEIRIRDFRIALEPSDRFLLPSIHIDVKIDVQFPW